MARWLSPDSLVKPIKALLESIQVPLPLDEAYKKDLETAGAQISCILNDVAFAHSERVTDMRSAQLSILNPLDKERAANIAKNYAAKHYKGKIATEDLDTWTDEAMAWVGYEIEEFEDIEVQDTATNTSVAVSSSHNKRASNSAISAASSARASPEPPAAPPSKIPRKGSPSRPSRPPKPAKKYHTSSPDMDTTEQVSSQSSEQYKELLSTLTKQMAELKTATAESEKELEKLKHKENSFKGEIRALEAKKQTSSESYKGKLKALETNKRETELITASLVVSEQQKTELKNKIQSTMLEMQAKGWADYNGSSWILA